MNGVLGEPVGTWNRPDAMDCASILVEHVTPACRALPESSDKAQSVRKGGRETKLDRLEAAGVL